MAEITVYPKIADFRYFCYYAEGNGGEDPEDRYLRARNAVEADHDDTDYIIGQMRLTPPWPGGYRTIVYRTVICFDTSNIPAGATIESAYLSMSLRYDRSDADFDIVIQNGQPTYPHDPPIYTDFDLEHYSGNGGSVSTVGGLPNPTIIEVNASGLNWIQKGEGAVTKFCLRSSHDINSVMPSNYPNVDYVTFRDYSNYVVKLVIQYILPSSKSSITTSVDIKLSRSMGKCSITTSVDMKLLYEAVNTIRAYKNGVSARMELTGDLTKTDNIFKRGFEYMIQDNQPAEEAEGTEIIEESEEEFDIGEYTLSDYDEELPIMHRNPLYELEEDTIFWFRAIVYIGEDKITGEWMKNVPTVITNESSILECIVFSTAVMGYGELTDLGANIVTGRGFRITKEFSGSLFDLSEYRFMGFDRFDIERRNVYNASGQIIDYIWVGNITRDSVYINKYGFELGTYEKILGGGLLAEGLGLYLKSNDMYKIQAIAENQLGRGFGEGVYIDTSPILVDDGGPISPYTKIENIRIMNIPDGYKVTRIGKRWGRTPSCNEGDIYEDGEWNNGDTITLFIVDLIPDTKYYFDIYYVLEVIEIIGEIKDASGKIDIDTDISIASINSIGGLIKSESGKMNIDTNVSLENLRMTFYNVSGKANINSSIWLWWIWKEFDYFEGIIFKCKVEGISGEEEPDWPKESGQEVIDGSIIWICEEGSMGGINDWQALTAYKVDNYVRPIYFSFETPEDPDYPDGLPDIEIPSLDLIGIDYTAIVKEIKCDIVAGQGIIDRYGRKRTLTIINDLIQTKGFCKSIRDNYLNRFQELKLKIEIDYDIPLPFEREDTILLAYGKINYKNDGDGVIEAKADGEGIISGKMSVLTKVRKININNATPKEAILTLELEV